MVEDAGGGWSRCECAVVWRCGIVEEAGVAMDLLYTWPVYCRSTSSTGGEG